MLKKKENEHFCNNIFLIKMTGNVFRLRERAESLARDTKNFNLGPEKRLK